MQQWMEMISSDAFLNGVLAGALVMGLIGAGAMRSYKRTLLYCAQGQTAEKLIDGKFYYLVPEGEYNAASIERHQLRCVAEKAIRVMEEALLSAQFSASLDTLLELKVALANSGFEITVPVSVSYLDVTGMPKIKLTVMENLALEAINCVQAWADGPHGVPFPVEARMKMDVLLGFAELRRQGVR